MMANRVLLQGGVTDIDAPLLTAPVRMQSAAQVLADGPVVAVDLSTTSRYHGLEISGLIGYSALSGSIVTVNYRDSALRIEPK
jgi:hypothetical protein